MDLGSLGRLDDLVFAGAIPAIGDVVLDRIIEQDCILRHHANGGAQCFLTDVANILTIDPDRALPDIIKPEQETRDR